MKTAYSRKKFYGDKRRRDIEFEIGDHVYLTISPMKGVMRLGKKRNLGPRYVGLFEVLRRIGKVAYELKLPSELASVHPFFHVSMFNKCIGDPVSILPIEGLGTYENLTYERFRLRS